MLRFRRAAAHYRRRSSSRHSCLFAQAPPLFSPHRHYFNNNSNSNSSSSSSGNAYGHSMYNNERAFGSENNAGQNNYRALYRENEQGGYPAGSAPYAPSHAPQGSWGRSGGGGGGARRGDGGSYGRGNRNYTNFNSDYNNMSNSNSSGGGGGGGGGYVQTYRGRGRSSPYSSSHNANYGMGFQKNTASAMPFTTTATYDSTNAGSFTGAAHHHADTTTGLTPWQAADAPARAHPASSPKNNAASAFSSSSLSESAEEISAATCRSFWSQQVRHLPAAELKRQHMLERAHDKRSRFLVRNRIRYDGVLSNLFPVTFHDEATLARNGVKADPYLYVYEMYVTRLVTPKAHSFNRKNKNATLNKTAGFEVDDGQDGRGGAPHLPSSIQQRTPIDNTPAPADPFAGNNTRNGDTVVSDTVGSASLVAGGNATTSTTSTTTAAAAEGHGGGAVERRVSTGRSWRAIQRFLRQRFSATAASLLPPLIQLDTKVYAAGPLPADALQLPKTYYDVGWKTAELRLVRRTRYADLPASELQMVLNKIVLELARETQRRDQQQKQCRRINHSHSPNDGNQENSEDELGVMEVVREKTGKLVCTMQGVSSGGLRVYRGIYVQAIFVDHTAAFAYESETPDEGSESGAGASAAGGGGLLPPNAASLTPSLPVLTTRQLTETPVGLTDPAVPVQFRVDAFLRAFTYRGTPVESYRISDASGSVLASVWAPAQPQALTVGAVYAAAPVRIREFAERGNARLVELPSGTVPVLVSSPEHTPQTTSTTTSTSTATAAASGQGFTKKSCGAEGTVQKSPLDQPPPSRLPGHVSLKIDTKGTIASEVSLWGEVLQHNGPGPYDEATQQRIRKALVHMPVVIAYSLRQGVIREVRFDGAALLAAAARGDPLLNISKTLNAASASADSTSGGDHQSGFESGERAGLMRESSLTALPITSGDLTHQPSSIRNRNVTQTMDHTAPIHDGDPTDKRRADAMSADSADARGLFIGAREPRLLPLLPFLDAQQPCAVLMDYTVVPLQVLHCCFDPSMKGWQDISVAVLSLMPNQRMELLAFVRRLLEAGLRRWGISVAARPWRTKALSVLPAPMKISAGARSSTSNIKSYYNHYNNSSSSSSSSSSSNGGHVAHYQRNVPGVGGSRYGAPAVSFPSTVVVLGVAGPRCTADQAQRVSLSVQHMGQYFRTSLVACVSDESAAVQFVHEQLMLPSPPPQQPQQQQQSSSGTVRDVNSCVILITTEPDTRATRWLKVECMSRGIHLLALPPSATPKRLNVLCASLKGQIATQFETDPLLGIDFRGELPVLGRRRVLVIGVDTCHTPTHSIGTIVGILSTPERNHLLSHFWQHNARGRETSRVALHFRNLLQKTMLLYGGVEEVVVFQDGDVFSELAGVKEELAAQLPGCGLTFMCLHKRCNIRFTHAAPETVRGAGAAGAASSASVLSLSSSKRGSTVRAEPAACTPSASMSRWNSSDGSRGPSDASYDSNPYDNNTNYTNASVEAGYHNVVKGVVITALAPIPLDYEVAAPSFYLQAHESAMSTARAVQYTVHHVSPTLDVADVQQMANVMANVLAPQATKLPMSTRCAHRLADRAERLLDAVPQFTGEMIPRPLSDRLWFL